MPVVANRKFLGQSNQDWKLLGSKALHDLTRVCGAPTCDVGGNKAGVVYGWVRATGWVYRGGSAKLLQHIRELVARIDRHHVIGTPIYAVRVAIKIVQFTSSEANDLSRSGSRGILPCYARETEHVVKCSVLQHQNKHVFDQVNHFHFDRTLRHCWSHYAFLRTLCILGKASTWCSCIPTSI